MAIADLQGKYHVKINGNGFIISHTSQGRMLYEKKPAPSFVNKTSSGDSSYRDSTFWQFWAQLNWRNGAKQERFDDAGKFWKSSNVDISQAERVKLSKALTSAGQIAAGKKCNTSVAWRASQSWWDANYGYRKQITIVAPTGVQIPAGYPIVITEDTAALQTASKVRSDRKDWRVVYWNGTSWTDLVRDYVSATKTVFATQAAIAAGSTDTSYFCYYGYSSASTSKQPTTDADWNEIYVPESAASTYFLLHCKEGTGTNVVDTYGTNDGTMGAGLGWDSAGKFGWCISTSRADVPTLVMGSVIDFDAFTFECFLKKTGSNNGVVVLSNGITPKFKVLIGTTGKISVTLWGDSGSPEYTTTNNIIADENFHHLAIVFNGVSLVKVYCDGDFKEDLDFSGSGQTGMVKAGDSTIKIGGFDGFISNIRFSSLNYTSFPYGFDDTITVTMGSEVATQPPASNFALYTGMSNGKIYTWDGGIVWTEVFDTRRVEWFESGGDTDKKVGDVGGVETAQSQGFQLAEAQTIKALEVYLKKSAGTPGDITVRIETDNGGVPSGDLVHANATTTIPAFSTSTYAWKEAVFTNTFVLAKTTLYHIVLKTATADNDNNYSWDSDASSPGYADGAMSASTDGGASWGAVAAADAYFRVKTQECEVYCSLVSSIGGTQKMYWGVGDISNETDGDARLYSYDGTTWALAYTFTSGTSSAVTAITEFGDALYVATAPQAYILTSTDASAWSQSTQIRIPQNPGFIYCMTEYNQRLYVGGGSPELLPDEKYNGFVYYFDGVNWQSLYPFDHTVVTCMGFYDAFLFIGTYHGQVYIFDASSIDPLINFKDEYDWQVSIAGFQFFDDKMYILLEPQEGSGDTNSALWLFERHGISAVNAIPSDLSVTLLKHAVQVNNTLMVGGDNGYMFKLDTASYEASGWLQTSYQDAILPSIDKLYNELKIQYDPLPTGCSIAVYYKFDEDDSWVLLDTANTPNSTTKTMSFATGVYSRKICFKYLLSTSDISQTPILRESVLKYTILPVRKWQWNIRILAKGTSSKDKIILLDKTQDTRSGTTIRGLLETAQDSDKLIQFYDVDGTAYTVLFNTLDEQSWVVQNTASDLNENTIAVTLIEA
jgi:hypothetical protein